MQTLRILKLIPDLTIVQGVGDYAEHTACVMSAVVAEDRLRRGEPLGEATDSVACVCPVVRALVIQRNDAGGVYDSDDARTEWALGMVPRLLNSRVNEVATFRRAEAVTSYAVHVIALESRLYDESASLYVLPKDVSVEEAEWDGERASRARLAIGRSARDVEAAARAIASSQVADTRDAVRVDDTRYYTARAADQAAEAATFSREPLVHLDRMIEIAFGDQ